MNPGIMAVIIVVLMLAAQRRRVIFFSAVVLNGNEGGSMDMSVLKSYVGRKVRIRSIDSNMSQEEGFIENILDSWIVLKDKKGREKLIKAQYIAKIDIIA